MNRERRAAQVSPPTLLYIMGTARSGTTILEVLLGSANDTAGLGEASYVWKDLSLDKLCSCGQPSGCCPFWAGVRERLAEDSQGVADIATLVQRLEAHRAFPGLLFNRLDKAELNSYRDANSQLFAAAMAESGSRQLVDSSKYAGRGLLLDRLFPGKVKLICVTRSSSGLMRAFRKKNQLEQRPKGFMPAVAYYLYVLACMFLVIRIAEADVVRVRFEDLRNDPLEVLRRLEEAGFGDFSIARGRLAKGEEFDVGHILTGNRLREAGRVRFEPNPGSETGDRERRAPIHRLLEFYRRRLGF